MSKIKKVLAMLLALAMVLGTTLTAFAAPKENATIEIKNAGAATFKYFQVIKAAPTATTGWDFVSKEVGDAFATALNAGDAQAAIQKMIDKASTGAEMQAALEAVYNMSHTSYVGMKNPQTVDKAGLYAITGQENKYDFSYMAAFVGFGEVKDGNGNVINEYPSLMDVEVNAKKQPTWVEKVTPDPDDAVAIGDEVAYEVNSSVPYLTGETDRYYKVIDEITGAEYKLNDNGKLDISVTIGTNAPVQYEVDVTNGTDADTYDQTFTLDLSDLVANNDNANLSVKIEYTAVVTGVQVGNDVFIGDGTNEGKHKFGSAHEDVYTGKITLFKYDAESDARTPLSGAGFEVRKSGETDALKFVPDVKTDGTQIAGSYTYAPKATTGFLTELFTDEKGEIIVNGLNVGEYTFTEKTAPDGFSINATPATAKLVINEEDSTAVAENIFEANTNMGDTRLSSLPSTGGIGTTIFTIGGCLIMIVAAGLFFASRRKSAK